jgi:hypothetical protein
MGAERNGGTSSQLVGQWQFSQAKGDGVVNGSGGSSLSGTVLVSDKSVLL